MLDYPNIDFNPSVFDSVKSDVHKHNLSIASLNLSDFNARNPEIGVIRLKYDDSNYTFERVHPSNPYHYSDKYLKINHIITMSRNPQWHSQWVSNFPNDMYGYFFGFYDRYEKREIDLFVKLFKDYYPLGDFLSEAHLMEIKSNFNERCRIAESYR